MDIDGQGENAPGEAECGYAGGICAGGEIPDGLCAQKNCNACGRTAYGSFHGETPPPWHESSCQ